MAKACRQRYNLATGGGKSAPKRYAKGGAVKAPIYTGFKKGGRAKKC